MIKRGLGLLLVSVLLGAGLSAIASAAPSDSATSLTSVSDLSDDALLVPQGSPTPSASGSPVPSPSPTGEPKKCPPKKGKGKKKKKGCPPQKPSGPPPCPTYAPGEAAAEAETTVLTDAATADAPVTVEIDTAEGLGVGREGDLATFVSHAFHNVQVDTSAAETGLYAGIEFTPVLDYDLYLDLADGTNIAASAGFMIQGTDGNDADSETAPGSETILGVKSADCQGYTLDIVSATSPGETITLSLWLGEATYTPAQFAVAEALDRLV